MDEKIVADLKKFGANSDLVKNTSNPIINKFEVWPQNIIVLKLFLRVSNQWRMAGMDGQPVSIDLGAVDIVARVMKIDFDLDILDDLQIMEQVVLSEIRNI